MGEYIERRAALREAKYAAVRGLDPVAFVEDVPVADVAPVVHGEWEIVVGSNGKEYMVCTRCRVSQDLTGVFTYCPNCGAKMDGGDSDEVD